MAVSFPLRVGKETLLAEGSQRRRLWEAILAVTLEESVRRFLPPLLPYIWFAILLGLTWETANDRRVIVKVRPFAQRLTKRWKMPSYFIVALLGAGLAVFYWWGVQKLRSALIEEKEGFRVLFRTQFFDMRRDLDNAAIWVLYKSGYGYTISPVALLEFLEITSLYAHPVSISSYSVAVKTDTCGWVYLTPIDARGVMLLFGASGLNAAQVIKLENNALGNLWMKPIPAYGTQFGMLLFDTKVSCTVEQGNIVQLKIELNDSTGKSFTYTSPTMAVLKTFTPGNSIGQENRASVELVGSTVNASQAHRRFHSDPIPDVIKEQEKGVASVFANGKVGTIFLEDGAFGPCGSCYITPRPAPSP